MTKHEVKEKLLASEFADEADEIVKAIFGTSSAVTADDDSDDGDDDGDDSDGSGQKGTGGH